MQLFDKLFGIVLWFNKLFRIVVWVNKMIWIVLKKMKLSGFIRVCILLNLVCWTPRPALCENSRFTLHTSIFWNCFSFLLIIWPRLWGKWKWVCRRNALLFSTSVALNFKNVVYILMHCKKFVDFRGELFKRQKV